MDKQERSQWAPFLDRQEVVVHARSDTHARPYINFEYTNYHGPGLLAVPSNEHKVIIVFDRRDIRRLQVRRLNGVELGMLDCPVPWRAYPHSVATRRLIFKEYRKGARRSESPLADFLAKKRQEITSASSATEFLAVYQEFLGQLGVQNFLSAPKTPLLPDLQAENSPSKREYSKLAAAMTHRKDQKRFWSIDLNNLNFGGHRNER